ncbi:MAG: choice-of-anchor tandem repeat GloVer-containing protein [Terriglobales bacterium]
MKARNTWRSLVAVFALLVATVVALPAQTFTVLKSFNGTNGHGSAGPLVQGLDGNLYGTSYAGGTNSHGTIFKVSTAGKLTTLYTFCPQSGCPDGSNPDGGLVLGTDGNFYGTTHEGGVGGGTVFKITPKGAFTLLYQFCSLSNCDDGELPSGELVQGIDGRFYGTTEGGGADGNGSVFKITSTGGFTTTHSFCGFSGCGDGAYPYAGLALGNDGNFYATNHSSGANDWGTFFQVTPGGTVTTLYNFCIFTNCTDGGYPGSGLVQGRNGEFYGTTSEGGTAFSQCPNGCGTIFKVTTGGALTTLHQFDVKDGYLTLDFASLVQGTDGNFYGTTGNGGSFKKGSIYQITPSGTFNTLESLFSSTGFDPAAGLVQATDGNFYGTTTGGGGHFKSGTVFRLSMGLGALVKTLPAAGKVASTVKILGTNLKGSTAVTFNGKAATFKVVSATEITTKVPAGATTGTVKVTTPSGTLSSNVPFRVTH